MIGAHRVGVAALFLAAATLAVDTARAADLTPEDEALLEIADLLWDLEMLEEMEPEELDGVVFDGDVVLPDPAPETSPGKGSSK